MIRMTSLLIVATTALAVPAAAQSSTSGVFLGAQVTGAGLNFSGATQKVNFGGGWGVHAGVGLGERWSVVANYDRNSLGTSGGGGNYDLGQWDALLRANFLGSDAMLRPYLTAGATGRVAKSNTFAGSSGTYTFSGISPSAGGGLQWFLSRNVALDGGVNWTFGNFNKLRDSGNSLPGVDKLDATGTRVMIGASVYPFSGR